MDGTEDPEIADGQSSRRKTVSILGYMFDNEEVDASDDAIGETFVSSNDDAEDGEQEVDVENNVVVGDCSGDENEEIENNVQFDTAGEGMDGESGGNLQYKTSLPCSRKTGGQGTKIELIASSWPTGSRQDG